MGRATMHFFSKIIVLFGSMTVLTILLIYTKKRAVLTNHVLLSMQNPKDHINERTLPDCVTFLNNAQAKAPSANIRGQVVGVLTAAKCGSTALKTMMEQHPDIELLKNDKQYDIGRGCLEYSKLREVIFKEKYDNPHKVVAFAHNNYLFCPEVFKLFEEEKPSKLIFLFCNPVKRSFSSYLQLLDHEKVPLGQPLETFESMMARTSKKLEALNGNSSNVIAFLPKPPLIAESDLEHSLISAGLYSFYIKEFLQQYSREDMLFLTGEQLIRDPAGIMKNIQSFLGLPQILGAENFVVDERTGFYCTRLNNQTKCLSVSKSRQGPGKPAIVPAVEKKLQDFYTPFNADLESIISCRFHWE